MWISFLQSERIICTVGPLTLQLETSYCIESTTCNNCQFTFWEMTCKCVPFHNQLSCPGVPQLVLRTWLKKNHEIQIWGKHVEFDVGHDRGQTLCCDLRWRGCSNYSSLRLLSSLLYIYRGGKEWKILTLTLTFPAEDYVGKSGYLQCKTQWPHYFWGFLQPGFCLWTHLRVKVRNFLRNSLYFMYSLSCFI